MIAENAGQDEARFSAVIEALSAVITKVTYGHICGHLDGLAVDVSTFENRTLLGRILCGDGLGYRSMAKRKELAGQIGNDQIASALATIKASTHHAKLMVRVHDRIVAEFPAGSEPVVRVGAVDGDLVAAGQLVHLVREAERDRHRFLVIATASVDTA